MRDCSRWWKVDIVWLEYVPEGEKQRKFLVMDYASASFKGEP